MEVRSSAAAARNAANLAARAASAIDAGHYSAAACDLIAAGAAISDAAVQLRKHLANLSLSAVAPVAVTRNPFTHRRELAEPSLCAYCGADDCCEHCGAERFCRATTPHGHGW
jgi:hypothetical protein